VDGDEHEFIPALPVEGDDSDPVVVARRKMRYAVGDAASYPTEDTYRAAEEAIDTFATAIRADERRASEALQRQADRTIAILHALLIPENADTVDDKGDGR